jgi:GNAT superfamily N-acetyltransferase
MPGDSTLVDVAVACTPDDFRLFRDLATEYEASLPLDLRHAEFERESARISEVYTSPDAAIVARIAAAACGCVAMTQLDASTAVVKKLYVKPEARRNGAARALMNALLSLARQRGFARLVLDTESKRLPQAFRLYEQLGFTPCDPCYDVTYESPTFMELSP